MRIGAAVADDGNRILPLSDGLTLKILDTESMQSESYPNPGYPLTQGRRAAATDFLNEQRVQLVLAVPMTFCSISQEKARSYNMQFALLPEGSTWDEVVAKRLWTDEYVVAQIPEDQLFKPKK
ncbi:MAG TPA: hypothetical protein VK464_07535 [Symbiobacteriaceae bacterium]|jgi:hypothetical protein|nr:hypothetical protein [Symbiobacteriaceae bacterium]